MMPLLLGMRNFVLDPRLRWYIRQVAGCTVSLTFAVEAR